MRIARLFLSEVNDKKCAVLLDYFLGCLAISVLTANALAVNNPGFEP